MTHFICGFPGVGKSHFYNNFNKYCQDSDSSQFSKNEDGTPNPTFIEDYFKHLLSEKDIPIILISTHEAVLKELKDRELDFTIIIPKEKLKEQYILRYKERGSPEAFIKLLDENWTTWLRDIKEKYSNYYELDEDQTLTDFIVDTYERY